MKKFISILLAGALAAAALTGCSKTPGGAASGNTPLVLNEVAHSIFYAPQYAAIELGYFEDEGIDLTLVNGAGADKVMTALSPAMHRLASWVPRPVSMCTRKAPRTMP